ncbi:MAG: aspartate aminotransferase [Myxococcota bacterium]|jgi:aspartate aminotransferase
MVPQLSKRALILQESAIRKLDLVVAEQTDTEFLRLNIGQPDVATPQPMLDAIAAFQPEVVAYGPASGTMACRKAAAAYMSRWCSELGPFDVAITTGGSEALLFAFTAICDPGDEIIVLEPYYTNYNGFATVAGAKITPVPTSLEDGFAVPSDDVLDGFVTERSKAIVFSNPGNPTGGVYGREALIRLAAWAKRHNLFIISDEVYRRIWFTTPPTSMLELDDYADRVVVVDSLSKTWSACGARLGFLVSRNAELMERVERLGQARLGPQPLAQAVGIAALAMPESYYETVRATYKSRVDALYGALKDVPGVKTHKPVGAFYFMVDLPVDDAEVFARWLVTDFRDNGQSVVVAPGGGFYSEASRGKTQIRLAAVIAEDRLLRAGELLAKAITQYTQR